MNRSKEAIDAAEDIIQQWEGPSKANRTIAIEVLGAADDIDFTVEEEMTCRRCRDDAEAPHDYDNFVSSHRWVTQWEQLTDPLIEVKQ